MLVYRVQAIEDLQVIVNHFDKFPLVSVKKGDFLLFKKAFTIIKRKEHLTTNGFKKLIGIRNALNLGLNSQLKEAFPDWKKHAVARPVYKFKEIPNPD
jgi:hypothetical protein